MLFYLCMLKIYANYSFYNVARKDTPSDIKAQTHRVLYRSNSLFRCKTRNSLGTSHLMEIVAEMLHTAIGEDISLEA